MRSLSTLSRHKYALFVVGVIALVAALSTTYRISASGLEARGATRGAATAQILIDSPQSALGNLRQNTEPLTTRAGVFAQFMASNGVRAEIAAKTGFPVSQIVARGPFDDPAAAPNGASAPDPAMGVVGPKPYILTFAAQESLPLVTVYAEAPDARHAAILADGAVAGVQSYVSRLQSQGKLPAWQRVVVRRLGAPEAGPVSAKGQLPKVVLAWVALFALGCGAVLLFVNVRSRRSRRGSPRGAAGDPAPVELTATPGPPAGAADSPVRVA